MIISEATPLLTSHKPAAKLESVRRGRRGTTNLVIKIYTNKQMLVRVYLDNGNVSGPTKSATTVKAEIP